LRLKDYLRGKLNAKERDSFPNAFDIVGDIAIFSEISKDLAKKENLIGNSLLKLHKNIKVVCKKVKKYSGKYRTPTLKIIAGEKRKETMYIENGIRLLLDVEKVYFSPRLGNERARISNMVNKSENVLVMFSGCGPYTCQIAKKAKSVTAIEANPIAHKYALKNLVLNKIQNAIVLKGDVKKIKLKEKFNRIIMPLPKDAESYLKQAFSVAKKGCIIHLYTFGKVEDYSKLRKNLLSECRKLKKKCKVLRIVKAGEYSPRVYRLCIDFKVQ